MSTVQPQAKRKGRPRKPGPPRRRINAWLTGDLVELLKIDAKTQGSTATDRLEEIVAAYYADRGVMRQSA